MARPSYNIHHNFHGFLGIFEEMLQMDASLHPWFGGEKSQLHIAVDDTSGAIASANN
ncbi:hypothetical protein [Clostridium sp. AWRP]|uniref:hypothetical protein n=1 Tax=Clostridium sp. AWRP TaxID=2212991 RepID=UPI001586F1B6|nr:hypothetical protein [Clostridium sp. AWRP]